MKVAIYAGGFKPFTTGHFSKLADAISAHQGEADEVYLYYGMQQEKPPQLYQRGAKKGQPKPDLRLRSIGRKSLGRYYTPGIGKEIFNIYKDAIERSSMPGIRNVIVIPAEYPATPISMTVDKIRSLLSDNSVEKVTVYGDGESYARMIGILQREDIDLQELVESGWIQLGSRVPESINDYLDPERLKAIVERGEETARGALATHYPGEPPEEIRRMQQVRGTSVRALASERQPPSEEFAHLGSDSIEVAKRFLPPFLSDEDKEKIIEILLTQGSPPVVSQEAFFPIITDSTIIKAAARFAVHKKIKEAATKKRGEGHIPGLTEDMEMTFDNLRQLIDDVLSGRVEHVEEKMDGQNFTFTVLDSGDVRLFGKGVVATTLEKGGKDRAAIEAAYKDDLQDAFLSGYDVVEEYLSARDMQMIRRLFQNGKVVVEGQIMTPINPNTIPYTENHVAFIKPFTPYTDIEIDQDAYAELFGDADVTITDQADRPWSLSPVPKLQQTETDAAEMLEKIKELQEDLDFLVQGMSPPPQTVGDYVAHVMESYVDRVAPQLDLSMLSPDQKRRAIERLAKNDKRLIGKPELGEVWPAFQEFERLRTFHVASALADFEKIIQKLGSYFFDTLEFTLATNEAVVGELAAEVERIKRANDASQIVVQNVDTDEISDLVDTSWAVKLDSLLSRVEQMPLFKKAVEGVVLRLPGPEGEQIVTKLTGMFTPIHRLVAMFRYPERKSRQLLSITAPEPEEIEVSEEEEQIVSELLRTVRGILFEGGNAFKDSEGNVITRTERIHRSEVSRIIDEFYEQVLQPLGLNYLPVGSTATDCKTCGDLDVTVDLASREVLYKLLVDSMGEDNVKKIGQLIAVKFQVPDSTEDDLVQIDVVPSAGIDDTAWMMRGGGEGKAKGVFRNLLFSHIAKEKSKKESSTLRQVKYTLTFPGGLLVKINGEAEDNGRRNSDPDSFLPKIGIYVEDKREVETFENLVNHMRSDRYLSVMLDGFSEYINNSRYLQSENENIRREAEKAINYIENNPIAATSQTGETEEMEEMNESNIENKFRSLVRDVLSEDIVYNSPAYGKLEVNDEGTETASPPYVSDLRALYQENMDAQNLRMAGLINLLNRELLETITINDAAAWERVGELMLSNLGFTQQTDIEGGPKVATFYDVLKDRVYYSVKTSFAKFARSPQTAFGASALKLSQLADYVMLPENGHKNFGCIGCIKRRPKGSSYEIYWGITEFRRGSWFKIDMEESTPEKMAANRGVQFSSPNIFIGFQEGYKGRTTRLKAGAAVELFGKFSPLWTIKLMEVPDLDPEIENIRSKLMRSIGASSEDVIRKILTVLKDEGLVL